MNKRGAGAIFCLIAAVLFAARYVVAGMLYGAAFNEITTEGLFKQCLQAQGNTLLIASIISLLAGVVYILWQEVEERSKR